MMNRVKDIIHRNINGNRVLLFFIITNLVYASMLFITIPKVTSFTNGMKLLDMMPAGYNAEYVSSLFGALGEKGRDAYLLYQIPADMIYPFLFGISYSFLLAYFLNKLNKLSGALFYLCLLPLFAGVFDYIENIGIITMLTNYPGFSKILVTITSVFTILKSAVTTIYFLVLIMVMAVFGIKFIRGEKSGGNRI